MLPIAKFTIAAGLLLLSAPALALRCQGKIISEGDPQPKVRHYCGKPAAVQQRLIYRGGLPRRQISVTSPGSMEGGSIHQELLVHERSVVEVLVEEWTYNLGPRKLMRVVRFENGLVVEVEQLGYGYHP